MKGRMNAKRVMRRSEVEPEFVEFESKIIQKLRELRLRDDWIEAERAQVAAERRRYEAALEVFSDTTGYIVPLLGDKEGEMPPSQDPA